MIYRTLGQSGLKVSALTLGSMMFGEQTNSEDSLRIIDKAWDQGINFIDTADVYTQGAPRKSSAKPSPASARIGCWPRRSASARRMACRTAAA